MILIAVVFLLSHVLMAAALRATAALLGSYRGNKRKTSAPESAAFQCNISSSHTPSVEKPSVVSHTQCGKPCCRLTHQVWKNHAVVSHPK